ncbi:hypothetical protein SCOCK_160117 [Actinacidiphila cocklensis]|uniref:Uncharacterized protein n=1 Tax=Actinacidiphila cocklensis TaxID=887465 RepID=A0A9W4DLU3_9ACTN|nr:hypothetical protein SCOCK_160117 [Actinacidiphila cocklensis]
MTNREIIRRPPTVTEPIPRGAGRGHRKAEELLLALVLAGRRGCLRHPCSGRLPATPPPSSLVVSGHPRAPSHGPQTAQS